MGTGIQRPDALNGLNDGRQNSDMLRRHCGVARYRASEFCFARFSSRGNNSLQLCSLRSGRILVVLVGVVSVALAAHVQPTPAAVVGASLLAP